TTWQTRYRARTGPGCPAGGFLQVAELAAHFYHVWADGAWPVPVREHFTALVESNFPGRVHVGLVGQDDARRHAEMRIRDLWPGELTVCASELAGFEQVTLSRLRTYVR